MLEIIVLGFIVLALLAGFGWYVRSEQALKLKLINALLAKDSQDYVNRTLAENTKITPEMAKSDPDLIPMDKLNEEQFDAMISQANANKVSDTEVVN